MKLEITANQSTTSAIMNAVADTVNEFKPDAISSCDRCEIEHKIRTSSHFHQGPAYNWQYATETAGEGESKTAAGTFTLNVEDEAVVMALPMMLKVAKVISPVVEMGLAACKLIRNMKDQFKGIRSDISGKINAKFGKPHSYAVECLWVEEIELFDKVVVEDNGFGELRLIHTSHCGKCHSADTIMSAFMAKKAKGGVEFSEEITREQAIENAMDTKGLHADVQGWRRKMNGDIAEDPQNAEIDDKVKGTENVPAEVNADELQHTGDYAVIFIDDVVTGVTHEGGVVMVHRIKDDDVEVVDSTLMEKFHNNSDFDNKTLGATLGSMYRTSGVFTFNSDVKTASDLYLTITQMFYHDAIKQFPNVKVVKMLNIPKTTTTK